MAHQIDENAINNRNNNRNTGIILFGVLLLIVASQWLFKFTESLYRSIVGRYYLNIVDYLILTTILIVLFIITTEYVFKQPITQFF